MVRGRWTKKQIELNRTFLTRLPDKFEIYLGAEKVQVVNKKSYGILIVKSFYLPSSREITVRKIGSEISAGPVLGIMARGLDDESAERFIRYFMKGSVLSYVFDESQLTKQQINGYYFDEEWHHLKLPKPNFVFDRTYPSRPENRSRLPRSAFINPITQFSKSQVAKILAQNGIAVPETFSGTFEKAYRMFSLFYLKPDRGSFGQDMFIVQKQSKDYTVYTSTSDTLHTYSANEIEWLLGAIQENGYILQRGIEPIYYKGEPADFRLHLLADPHPRVTFIAARTSRWPFLYTSAPKRIIKTGRVLSEKDKKALEDLAIKVHSVISKVYGPYVELSLDVVQEKSSEKFYVIDVNGKSTRVHPQILRYDIEEYFRAPEKLANHLFVTGGDLSMGMGRVR